MSHVSEVAMDLWESQAVFLAVTLLIEADKPCRDIPFRALDAKGLRNPEPETLQPPHPKALRFVLGFWNLALGVAVCEAETLNPLIHPQPLKP